MAQIREDTYSGAVDVDREAGVIRGVKILGEQSKNGRRYSRAALEQAAGLYENIAVNPDHREDHGVFDAIGWIESPTIKPDGVYGDLHVEKAGPLANRIFERAERNPRAFGLSQDAEGVTKQQDGVEVVEEITDVRSVDLVARPASTKGLFESKDPPNKREKPMKLKIREVLAKYPKHKAGVRPVSASGG
jgi:hypothetical protein